MRTKCSCSWKKVADDAEWQQYHRYQLFCVLKTLSQEGTGLGIYIHKVLHYLHNSREMIAELLLADFSQILQKHPRQETSKGLLQT